MKFFLILLFLVPLYADDLTLDPPQIQGFSYQAAPPPPCPPEMQVIVDLVDPVYTNGVLTTESGGVLLGPDLRIQAQQITYTRQLEGDCPVFNVTCSGNLLIDYKEWVLCGDTLYYDFITKRGVLTNGRTASPPWYVIGREFLLEEEGDLIILDGVITTSEGEVEDLSITAARIALSPGGVISAKHINARINEIPVFWLPFIKLDVNNIGRSPFAVQFGWQGFLGSYLSVLYRFLSWGDFEATARIDGFLGRGVGFGIETAFAPEESAARWFSRNYYAHDIPLDDPGRHDRYRFQGTYFNQIGGWTFDGLYDFVSDAEMAADYTTQDFALTTAGETRLAIRRKTNAWLASLFTRVRVNDFQSINQELPSFQLQLHPFEIPRTGILFEHTFQASYLDYVFSEDVRHGKNFSSGRVATHPFFYRPTFFGPLTVTPEAGFMGIAYSQSPLGKSRGQALGEFGVKLETVLTKCSVDWKHVVEPYLHYTYLTKPAVSPHDHYIFSIQDGWDRLNQLRFGVKNSFFLKTPGCLVRPLWVELWANAFFDTPTIPVVIPRGYLNLEWLPFDRLALGMEGGWNFRDKQLDYTNARIDYTLNENVAFGIEYRHRSRYDWRKADFYNFILESFHSQSELLHSPLSDRRDTLLFRIFTRPTPDWIATFDFRHGWNREHQRSYFEYHIECGRILFQHWRCTLSYEKLEADDRFRVSLLMLPGPL